MMTCETPSDEFERSSSMPLIVLTASSIWSVIFGLDLFRRGSGKPRRDDDGGEVDLREPIQPEAGECECADDSQRER